MSGSPLMESNAARNFFTARQMLLKNMKNSNSKKGYNNRQNVHPYRKSDKYNNRKRGSDSDDEGVEIISKEEKEIDHPKTKAPVLIKPFIQPCKKVENSQKTTKKDEDIEGEFSGEVFEILQHPNAKNLEAKIVDRVINSIIEKNDGKKVDWTDIAGLKSAKENIREIILLPMLKPQLFVGLRAPSKGILLFGPPGTGKTLIGKCIASQSCSTFFSISASSLTSKWIGEGEKMVRALFAIARIKQPSVIFIDEIDSLLTQRNDSEHESSRRLKTEFLVQFDGLTTDAEERLLVIGATNRPHELDEAARRRFNCRLYIPLPNRQARRDLIKRLINAEKNTLTESNFDELCLLTKGYSGADICCLCREAAYGPIRKIMHELEKYETKESLPPITIEDFHAALDEVKATVSPSDLTNYIEWNKQFGRKKDFVEDDDLDA